MKLWDYVVTIHQTQDWSALLLFWGVVVACLLFVCLQLLLVKGRRAGYAALEVARKLMDDIRTLESQLEDLEHRSETQLDSRIGEMDARMTRKLDQKGDLIQERIDQRSSMLADEVNKLDSRISRSLEEVERFRVALKDVEGRIPNLFDRLDEFRETLGKTFQAELGSVLSSFDTSVTSILHTMKSELQMGIGRIESIESMVRGRHRAERALLKAPEPPEVEPDEEEFAEWEEQAKEMEAQAPAAPAASAPAEAGDAERAEAAEETPSDEFDAALLAEDVPPREEGEQG